MIKYCVIVHDTYSYMNSYELEVMPFDNTQEVVEDLKLRVKRNDDEPGEGRCADILDVYFIYGEKFDVSVDASRTDEVVVTSGRQIEKLEWPLPSEEG